MDPSFFRKKIKKDIKIFLKNHVRMNFYTKKLNYKMRKQN